VKTIVKRPGCYTLAQLEAWLKDARVLLTRRHEEKTRNTSPSDFFSDFFAAFKAPIDVDQRLAEMQHHGPGETSIHQTQLSVTAALLKRGLPIDDVVSRVLQATVTAAGREGSHWDWFGEERDLREMCRTWLKKHPQVYFVKG
jgi:hypothetical protein